MMKVTNAVKSTVNGSVSKREVFLSHSLARQGEEKKAAEIAPEWVSLTIAQRTG